MQALKLTLAYKGTHFNGWQIQPKGRTVQGVLEKTIAEVLKEPIQIMGASRTDAGVHARGQVACVHYQTQLPAERFKSVVNRSLPDDLAIVKVEETTTAFHPIMDTKSKIYHYHVLNRKDKDPFKDDYVWHVHKPLDLEKMQSASKCLIGTHDFQSFCSSGSNVKSTVRTIYSIEIEKVGEDELIFKYHGNGFLYNMIRIITAMLVRVGEGKLESSEVERILLARDRSVIPYTAPGKGLFLHEIFY